MSSPKDPKRRVHLKLDEHPLLEIIVQQSMYMDLLAQLVAPLAAHSPQALLALKHHQDLKKYALARGSVESARCKVEDLERLDIAPHEVVLHLRPKGSEASDDGSAEADAALIERLLRRRSNLRSEES